MNTMVCSKCEGSKIEHNCRVVGRSEASDSTKIHLFSSVDWDSIKTCYSCKGHGVQTKNGQAYKTAGMALKGKNGRTARRCHLCNGEGETINTTIPAACYSCSGQGEVPVYIPGATFDRERWSYCDSMDKTVQASFAETVEIGFVSGSMSTGEGLLGMGCLWSCTDYGDMYQRLKTALDHGLLQDELDLVEREIREDLAKDRTQWTKILDPNNVIAGKINVKITHNGYAVKASF